MNLKNLVLDHTFGKSPRYTLKPTKEPQEGDITSSAFHRKGLDDSHTLVFYILSEEGREGYSVKFRTDGKKIVKVNFECDYAEPFSLRSGWRLVKDKYSVENVRNTANKLLPLYYELSPRGYKPHEKGFLSLEEYINALLP